MGFHRDAGAPEAGAWNVTGDDVHAWVEVAFDGTGWVPFDPTPPEDQVPLAQSPRARQEPQPEVLQPPPPPEAQVDLPPEALPDDTEEDEKEEAPPRDWAAIVRLVALIVIPLLAVLTPIAVIVGRKRQRRRRRQEARSASARVSGGWREIVDYATDLGVAADRSRTRWENAGALAQSFEAPGVLALALRADAGVFGGVEPSDAEAAAYWADVATARHEIGSGVGWWRRAWAVLAVASLRRRTQQRRDKER
jgi:hypothetical protein